MSSQRHDHHNLPAEDAEVIVAIASLFHDLGMSIHRVDHELYSLFLAGPKIKSCWKAFTVFDTDHHPFGNPACHHFSSGRRSAVDP